MDDLWNSSNTSDFYRDVQNLENGVNMLNNSINAWKTNETNQKIAEQSNEWAYRTAMELADKQAENEYLLWSRQLNTNAYDVKLKQLQQAGINPFVAAGKVANVQSESLHAAAPSVPHSTAFPYQPYMLPVDSVSGLAAAYQALAQGKKSEKETERIGDLLAGEVEGQFWDNAVKEFQFKLDNAFSGLERNANLRKVKQDISESVERASMYAEQGNLYSMEYQLKDAERYLQQVRGQIEEERYNRLNEFLNAELDEIRSRSESNRAKANESSAHAALFNSQRLSEDADRAFEENKIRPYVARMIQNDASMSDNEMSDYYATRPERLKMIFEEAEQAGIITSIQKQELRSATARGDYAGARELIGTLSDAARSYRDFKYGSSSGYTNRSRTRRY